MYKSGETPGKGIYTCKCCGQKIVMQKDTDKLPPCPECDNNEFE